MKEVVLSGSSGSNHSPIVNSATKGWSNLKYENFLSLIFNSSQMPAQN